MLLDHSRFDAFWRNPERYRLVYEQNLVPAETAYSLQRGIGFHRLIELSHAGASQLEMERRLAEETPNVKARQMAWRLFRAWQEQFNPAGPQVVASELEFRYDIPDSPHSMVGRIDQILKAGGKYWIGENKTGHAKKSFGMVQEDWRTNKQADYYMIGATTFGYKIEGVLVRVVLETSPPRIWPLEVHRTERQLEHLKVQVHQTCELIQFMRSTFGIDQPWPHMTYCYPCSKAGYCEHEVICGRPTSGLTQIDLRGFKKREEHLRLLT